MQNHTEDQSSLCRKEYRIVENSNEEDLRKLYSRDHHLYFLPILHYLVSKSLLYALQNIVESAANRVA